MITGIRIGGFKRFPLEGRACHLDETKGITFLIGPNSAGKSSVIQALLVLGQSWEHSLGGLGVLRTSGERIDAGRFDTALHRTAGGTQEKGLALELKGQDGWFQFHWAMPAPDEASKAAEGWLDLATIPLGGASLVFDAVLYRTERRVELCLRPNSFAEWKEAVEVVAEQSPWFTGEESFLELRCSIPDDPSKDPVFSVDVQPWASPEAQKELWDEEGLDEDQRTALEEAQSSALSEARARFGLAWGDPNSMLSASLNRLVGNLRSIREDVLRVVHIGGVRETGCRIYVPQMGDHPVHVGESGQRMVDVIENMRHAGIDIVRDVNRWLGIMEMGYRVTLRELESRNPALELLLECLGFGEEGQRERRSGNQVGLPDVGRGVGQVLPILVQLSVLKNKDVMGGSSILVIEQPEVHLHPRSQAQFAAVLAECFAGEMGHAVQVILESHSEAIFEGLANLVESGELKPEMVHAYRFKLTNERNSTEVVACPLNSAEIMKREASDMFPERYYLATRQLPTVHGGVRDVE